MQSLTAYDLNPTADLADIQQGITYLAGTQQSNLVFGLTALQDLPDEAQAQKLGLELYKQANLGPEDDPNTDVGDLTSAFSIGRLQGLFVIESALHRAAHHDARSDLVLCRYLIPNLSPGLARMPDRSFLLL
jgi:hypothetical protein